MRNSVFLLIALCPPAFYAQSSPKIGTLEKQVQQYLQQQKPQLAIPVLRDIVSLDPKNSDAQGNLGVLLFFDGKYTEAIPHMRAAVQAQPDLWQIEALLGIAEKRTGDPIAARNELDRAFPHLDDPKIKIQAGLELIELHAAASQFDSALSIAASLRGLAPQDPQILFAAYRLARQIMDQSLLSMTIAAPGSAEMKMIMANELARQGDHANAITHYREAIRLKPALPGVHYELAEQLRTSSDPTLNAQAEAEYKAAIQANPFDELSWRELGGIDAAKGDLKAAEEAFKKALALQPADSEAQTGLAIAFISLNRQSEALTLLESAVKGDPSNIVAHFRLAALYRRAGRTADADRELDAFHHYQDVKDKLGKAFRQMSGPANPM
ncbi:MAG: tetratricopeptide repeat protein [Terriglobia bacterium]